jgi:hypothetical protein
MNKLAYIIGKFIEGDVVVERFRRTAWQLHYDVRYQSMHGRALNMLNTQSVHRNDDDRDHSDDTDDRVLVLFCVDPGLQEIPKRLLALQAPNRQIVVYAHPLRASPEVAIEYCHAGLAEDYLVWGEATADCIEEHVKALHVRGPLYPEIRVGLSAERENARVFIATPYDRDNRMVMSEAVDRALRRVKLTPCWADTFYRDSSVPEQIQEEINRSKLLIANISAGPNAVHNPNVYYEAGQATALHIPVIFVRPRTEEKLILVPADIIAHRRLVYDGPIDLSMQLYHGFRSETC